jgi:hypothetical protein
VEQGRQVIQGGTDRGQIRTRDRLKVDSDELEGLTVGVLHMRQGRVESPAKHVVEPQIAEHECRSGENFIDACQIAFKRDPLSRPIPTPRGVTSLGG